MAIHDYICSNCTQSFELIVIPPNTPVCPHCGSTKLFKSAVPSNVSVFFRGTGWGGDKPKKGEDKTVW